VAAELVSADRRFWEELTSRVGLDQRETAGNLLWVWVNQLTLFIAQGQREAALDRLERARQIAPADPDLEALASP